MPTRSGHFSFKVRTCCCCIIILIVESLNPYTHRRDRSRMTRQKLLSGTAWLVLVALSSIDYVKAFAPITRTSHNHDLFRSTSDQNRLGIHTVVLGPGNTRRKLISTLHPSRASGSDDNETDDISSSAWIFAVLLPLWLVYVSNQWSRSSIYYLVDFSSGGGDPFRAMNVDLDFSQSQYGVLASVAFTSLFAVASLAAGVASDRYNRKVLTIASVVSWSVATLGTSLSSSYTEVVGWRVAMGLACAFSTPTAYTLLQQLVPKDKTALASSLYGSGVALGGSLAALSVLLDANLGWRDALVAISVFGFASAGIAALALPDDPKETTSEETISAKDAVVAVVEENGSITSEIADVIATSRVKWLFLGSFFRFCSGLCIGVWAAPYYRMVFPENQSEYAIAQATITAVFGVSSGLLGGVAADWVAANTDPDQDGTGRKLWIPVIGCILAAPTWYLSVHSNGSFENAMAWLAVEYLVAECWFGPTISVLQSTVGPKIGGTAQGMFTLTGAVGNLAPSLLGFLYGQAASVESSEALTDLLSTAVCTCYLLSAACFAVSAQSTPPPDDMLKKVD